MGREKLTSASAEGPDSCSAILSNVKRRTRFTTGQGGRKSMKSCSSLALSLIACTALIPVPAAAAQKAPPVRAQVGPLEGLKYRLIGPFRGGLGRPVEDGRRRNDLEAAVGQIPRSCSSGWSGRSRAF